jgi:hypothetical protein
MKLLCQAQLIMRFSVIGSFRWPCERTLAAVLFILFPMPIISSVETNMRIDTLGSSSPAVALLLLHPGPTCGLTHQVLALLRLQESRMSKACEDIEHATIAFFRQFCKIYIGANVQKSSKVSRFRRAS